MDPLFSYTTTNVHNHASFLYSLFLFFYKTNKCNNNRDIIIAAIEKDIPPPPSTNKKNPITLAAITPAQTTTQLLLSYSNTTNTTTQSACFSIPSSSQNLSILLLQSKVSSNDSVGHLQPHKINDKLKQDPPAAQQPKRPAWTATHAYLRSPWRTNSHHLRILTTELNMIRASKITRSLKPRKTYLHQPRKDEFIWGNPSGLRISTCANQQ